MSRREVRASKTVPDERRAIQHVAVVDADVVALTRCLAVEPLRKLPVALSLRVLALSA